MRINFKVQLPEWFNRLYPEAKRRLTADEKVVYLTFDDGPVPGVTHAVLDILKERNIEATFFCVGDNVLKHPEVFSQICNDGHATGNHTFNHLHGLKNSNEVYFSNIEKAAGLIHSNLFRPPYGLLKKSQYRELIKNYTIILWDVISCDYDSALNPEKCYNNVMDFVRNGSIITFHDSYKAEKNVLTVLPRVIDQLLREGYSFKKIEFSAHQSNSSESKAGLIFRKHNMIRRIRERA